MCVVLFADDTLDFRTGNAASRINYALTQGISVFVIVDGACHSSVQSKLETAFSNGGVPRLLSLHNLGKSYGTVSLIVDGIIRHTDSAIDRTRPHETTHSSEQHAGNGAHPEALRHLTNAEKRAAERGAGVRGGLVALLRQNDGLFVFRLFSAMYIQFGMAYTVVMTGIFNHVINEAGGNATQPEICNTL